MARRGSQTRIPAEAFHPGSHVREEIEARGWTVDDLAEKTLIQKQVLEDLIAERRDIVPILAYALGEAFGTNFAVWIGLQTSWRRWKRMTG